MTDRKSSRKLVGEIASALTFKPKNITEIAEEINADRKAVKNYLEALSNAPNIKEYDIGKENERKFGRSKICSTCKQTVPGDHNVQME